MWEEGNGGKGRAAGRKGDSVDRRLEDEAQRDSSSVRQDRSGSLPVTASVVQAHYLSTPPPCGAPYSRTYRRSRARRIARQRQNVRPNSIIVDIRKEELEVVSMNQPSSLGEIGPSTLEIRKEVSHRCTLDGSVLHLLDVGVDQ